MIEKRFFFRKMFIVADLVSLKAYKGLSLTGRHCLYPLASHFNVCLLLIQPKKTYPDITEKLLTGM